MAVGKIGGWGEKDGLKKKKKGLPRFIQCSNLLGTTLNKQINKLKGMLFLTKFPCLLTSSHYHSHPWPCLVLSRFPLATVLRKELPSLERNIYLLGCTWASHVALVGKNLPAMHKRLGFSPWSGKIPWSRTWQPTLVFLPGESHGQRSLEGYSPWGRRRAGHDWVMEDSTTHSLALSLSTDFRQSLPLGSPKATVDDLKSNIERDECYHVLMAWKFPHYNSFCILVEQTWVSQPWQYQHIIFILGICVL